MKHLRRLVVAVGLVCVIGTTGCAAWWQAFEKDPVAESTTLAQDVQLAIQIATTLWNAIAPLLGANQATATATFNQAVATLQHSTVAMQAAVAAAVAAQQPQPDLSAFISDIQAGIAQVQDIIAQYSVNTGTGRAGASASDFTVIANTIKHWR